MHQTLLLLLKWRAWQPQRTYKANNYTGYTQGDYNLAFNVVAPGETTAKTVNISVTSADTIDNVISKLNSSDLGVSAFKDKIWNGTEYVETIAFSSKATGAGAVYRRQTLLQLTLCPVSLVFLWMLIISSLLTKKAQMPKLQSTALKWRS